MLIKNSWLYLKLSLPLTLLFVVIYGSANWLNSYRADYYHIYFEWEKLIPLIPEMILLYLSIALLFLLPLFHCNAIAMKLLAKRMALAIGIAGLLFVLFPTQAAFIRSDVAEPYQLLFSALHRLDLQHNLFPSLHITLSTLVIAAFYNQLTRRLKIIYLLWLAGLYLSVLFVHQHHLADIAGGIALAFLCVRLLPDMDKNILVQ